MVKRSTSAILAYAVEAVAGEAETLTASNAIRIVENQTDFSYGLTGGVLPTIGAGGGTDELTSQRFDFKTGTVTFQVPVHGSGSTASTAALKPEYADLFRACRYSGAVDATGYLYTLAPNGTETVTLLFDQDGIFHQIYGAQGTYRMVAGAGNTAYFEFTMSGKYTAPADDTSFTGITFDSGIDLISESMTLTVGGFSGIVSDVTFDCGISVSEVPDVNSPKGVYGFRGGKRTATLTFTYESVDLSDFNPFSRLTNETNTAFSFTLGSSSGDKFTVSADYAQVSAAPTTSVTNDVFQQTVTLTCYAGTGGAASHSLLFS